jgi:hypothetical protein
MATKQHGLFFRSLLSVADDFNLLGDYLCVLKSSFDIAIIIFILSREVTLLIIELKLEF